MSASVDVMVLKPGDGDSGSDVVVLTGPTASGKGRLAFELARQLGGEIVSVDSMKVYREMDIATAKPSEERRRAVPYHLIGILDPHEGFSVARYLELLEETLAKIAERGNVAILCGGTALYLKAWLDGLQEAPGADWELRERLLEQAARGGAESLHERLQVVDPEAAVNIHPADTLRLVRALEIHEATGQAPSTGRRWGREAPRRSARSFALAWDRKALYARIDRRVEHMVERGLFEESVRLRDRKPPISRSAAQSLGYKEVVDGLSEGVPQARIIERIQQGTRRFAKRQLTWFRKFSLEWLEADETVPTEALLEQILRRLEAPEEPAP